MIAKASGVRILLVGALLAARVPGTAVATSLALLAGAVAAFPGTTGRLGRWTRDWRLVSSVVLAFVPGNGWLHLHPAVDGGLAATLVLLCLPDRERSPAPVLDKGKGRPGLPLAATLAALAAVLLVPAVLLWWAGSELSGLDEAARGGIWLVAALGVILALASAALLRGRDTPGPAPEADA